MKKKQHAKTLEFFASRPGAKVHYFKWFWSLPFWLDLQGLRVVHAAWDQAMIGWLLTPALTPERLALTRCRSSEAFRCLDAILKDIEVELPEGVRMAEPIVEFVSWTHYGEDDGQRSKRSQRVIIPSGFSPLAPV